MVVTLSSWRILVCPAARGLPGATFGSSQGCRQSANAWTLPHFLLAVVIGVVIVCALGCQPPREAPAPVKPITRPSTIELGELDTIRPQVEAFCGNCHSPPRPDSFPKDAWPFEVSQGFDFYYETSRRDLQPPSQADVTAYYQSLAPESLNVPPPLSPGGNSRIEFRRTSTQLSEVEPPAVSFIAWRSLQHGQPARLLFADMRSGQLRALPAGNSFSAECELLMSCANPAHMEPCDLDGDGQLEWVVAELGSLQSGDHFRGAVIWLYRHGDRWKQRLLLSGVGRVADVQPGDFDKDGDQDLLVAEFGHFRTGRILLLENVSVTEGVPQFSVQVLDTRHGTIHVPVADLNGDGHLDFVALISQEYELVEAFLNNGDATFRRELLFSGQDPAFGSSGIQIIDLDADSDLDVLYSNGDTFGSEHLKDYHGIRWLENRGQYPFEDHLLANMVGVQKALAGDLDSDGDLDVVAAGLMPTNLLASPQLKDHDSLIWLEQTQPGSFVRHALERAEFYHAGLELADFDQDGDLDVIVGNMYREDGPLQPWLTLWSNSLIEKD